MAPDTHAAISIGQFSRLTRLSVRMLRYYDEHGVLVPAHTDPVTGYRSYVPQQFRDAGRVRMLRDLGFGVVAIASLLPAGPEDFLRAMRTHRVSLEADARETAERLRTLDTLLAHYRGNPMTLDISDTIHPAQTVIALRRIIPTFAAENELWTDMMATFPPAGMSSIAGPALAIFHDAEYREADVDVEIALPVASPIEVVAPLECRELPPRHAVVATVNGPYDQVTEATHAAAAWADAQGLDLADGMYNRYLVGPAQNTDPDAWVTEVCLTVADREETPDAC